MFINITKKEKQEVIITGILVTATYLILGAFGGFITFIVLGIVFSFLDQSLPKLFGFLALAILFIIFTIPILIFLIVLIVLMVAFGGI